MLRQIIFETIPNSNPLEMIRVLITSFGSNTSIGVAKSLQKDCFIVGTDSNPFYECNGYSFANVIENLPFYNDITYAEKLLFLVDKHKINCIIPIHDKEIEAIARLRDEGNLPNVKVATNSLEITTLCNDKTSINHFLNELIPIPKVYTSLEDKINFPVIVKDNDGVSSRNIEIVNNIKELKNIDLSNKIIQEFIVGEEFTVDCYLSYLEQDLFYYSVRKRLETRSGMSVKSIIIDDLLMGTYCKIIHQKLGYRGASNIQFIVKNNQPYFIEINPRFAGAGILTYKSGYNFPLMTINELCNRQIDKDAQLQIGNKMVRYYEETFFDESNHCIRL